jgi:hypothetical protein
MWSGSVVGIPVALIALDLVICVVAAAAGGNRPNRHFVEGELITWLNALQLLLTAVIAVAVFGKRLRQARGAGESARFWLLVAFGSLFLALDEVLTFHESLGQFLRESHLPRLPLLNGWGDAVLLVYGIVVMLICWWYRRELLANSQRFRFLVLGALFLVISELVDFFGVHEGRERFWWSVTEETFKLMGFGALLGATAMRLLTRPALLSLRDGTSYSRVGSDEAADWAG